MKQRESSQKIDNQWRNKRYKEEPSNNFTNETYNNLNEMLNKLST